MLAVISLLIFSSLALGHFKVQIIDFIVCGYKIKGKENVAKPEKPFGLESKKKSVT